MPRLKEDEFALVGVQYGETGHVILIEKIEGDMIYIIDPEPIIIGSSYTMELKEFEYYYDQECIFVKK